MAKTSHTTRIAIVIPCYNYADYLSEALESVLAQLPRVGVRIECVVIDDGSTDDSRKEAEKFKSRGVRYHYRKNGGLSAARNTGLEQTKSDYVCFLDADDKLEPTFVNTCLDALKAEPKSIGYVYTQMQYFGDDKRVTQAPDFDEAKIKRMNYIHASAFFRRECFDLVSYDERLRSGFEDWDLYLTLAERGITGRLVDQPLLAYRKHTTTQKSMSDQFASELKGNRLQLRIQLKHWRFVSLRAVAHTLLRVVRLQFGVQR
jgi:glycosyltransferase involved in cell wall biosynthesis